MTHFTDQDFYSESNLYKGVMATGERESRRSKPLDPTTAGAMRLAQLRAEERAALSQGDTAAIQEIRRSIRRELA